MHSKLAPTRYSKNPQIPLSPVLAYVIARNVLLKRKKMISTSQDVEPLFEKLSSKERKAITITWNHIKGRAGMRKVNGLMVRVFDKISEKEPIRKLFVNAIKLRVEANESTFGSMYSHGKVLAEWLDQIINPQSMSEEPMALTLQTVGFRHANLKALGFGSHMWDDLGEILAHVITSQECVKTSPHAVRAWNLFIASFVDQLDNSCKKYARNRRMTSVGSEGAIKPEPSLINSSETLSAGNDNSLSPSKIQIRNKLFVPHAHHRKHSWNPGDHYLGGSYNFESLTRVSSNSSLQQQDTESQKHENCMIRVASYEGRRLLPECPGEAKFRPSNSWY